MKILEQIKKLNKENSTKFIDSEKYWNKSPSNILLKRATSESLAEHAQDMRVLDAGAGRLAYKNLIKKYAKSYVSSDFSKTHKDLDVVCDIEEMSFKDGEFDVVFCSQVLEHVPHPTQAFAEINRVLKKNGIAIITVPLLGYIHNAPHDYFRYTKYGLETIAKENNFSLIQLEEIGGFFCFLGYVRSTFLMPFFTLPILGNLIFFANYFFAIIDILLDEIIKNKQVFPLNYLLVIKKN